MATPRSTRNIVALLLVTIAVAAVIYWLASGAHTWTQTEVETEVRDELFGTISKEWRPEFQIGLEYTALIAVPLLIAAAWLGFGGRRRSG